MALALCKAWAWFLYKIYYYPHGSWGYEYFALHLYAKFNEKKAKELAEQKFPPEFRSLK
jgi:hypothetical protein